MFEDDFDCPPPPEAPKMTIKERSEKFDRLYASKKSLKPPVPAPRSKPYRSTDEALLKSRFVPFSPTKSLQKDLEDCGPPLVPQKKLIKQSSAPASGEALKDDTKYKDVYTSMKPWKDVNQDLSFRGFFPDQVVLIEGEHLHEGVRQYERLMRENEEDLKKLVTDLRSIADNLDKVSKGTKIAGITGGASTVAGGAAAAVGVFLAPFTAGFSLALTVAGVGMATAGGVTGASAAIANKVNVKQDKKKMNMTLKDFKECFEKIQSCLRFINEGLVLLKEHGPDRLNEAKKHSERVAAVVKLAQCEASCMSSEMSIKTCGIIDGFASGMDLLLTQEKNVKKTKKGLESKLAKKFRELADTLDEGLKDLLALRAVFRRYVN